MAFVEGFDNALVSSCNFVDDATIFCHKTRITVIRDGILERSSTAARRPAKYYLHFMVPTQTSPLRLYLTPELFISDKLSRKSLYRLLLKIDAVTSKIANYHG